MTSSRAFSRARSVMSSIPPAVDARNVANHRARRGVRDSARAGVKAVAMVREIILVDKMWSMFGKQPKPRVVIGLGDY